MNSKEVISKIRALKNPKNIEGMARFGIKPKADVYGVSVPEIRKIAKEIKKDHKLAIQLFDSGIHEARLLATMIADADKLTENQLEKWVKSFDSWDIVDQACMNVLDNSKIAIKKIPNFAKREKEFEKRVAFSLIAVLAVHDKTMSDEKFIKFFPLIKKASSDERNFVRKSVNWALRQIGKRNKKLNRQAIKLAKEIQKIDAKSAAWVASNALTELMGENVQKRLLVKRKV